MRARDPRLGRIGQVLRIGHLRRQGTGYLLELPMREIRRRPEPGNLTGCPRCYLLRKPLRTGAVDANFVPPSTLTIPVVDGVLVPPLNLNESNAPSSSTDRR